MLAERVPVPATEPAPPEEARKARELKLAMRRIPAQLKEAAMLKVEESVLNAEIFVLEKIDDAKT